MSTDLEQLLQELVAFRERRDWKRFHTPRNLSMALASEVGELLAELRWVTDDEILDNDAIVDAITDEIADVGIFLLLLCESVDVDLATAIRDKIGRNEERFPAERPSSKRRA